MQHKFQFDDANGNPGTPRLCDARRYAALGPIPMFGCT